MDVMTLLTALVKLSLEGGWLGGWGHSYQGGREVVVVVGVFPHHIGER